MTSFLSKPAGGKSFVNSISIPKVDAWLGRSKYLKISWSTLMWLGNSFEMQTFHRYFSAVSWYIISLNLSFLFPRMLEPFYSLVMILVSQFIHPSSHSPPGSYRAHLTRLPWPLRGPDLGAHAISSWRGGLYTYLPCSGMLSVRVGLEREQKKFLRLSLPALWTC